jgi:thiamine-phosphate pyrophosphorylase
MRAARRLGVRIIINDRSDIALAVEADGVHLGQHDLPADCARALVGDDRIVGFSTHSLKQALEASRAPIDYIAIGPVFGTSTKENPDPVVGLDIIGEIKRRTTKPVIAIGGITLGSARSVIEAGADSLAVISDLYATGDIRGRVREFIERTGPRTL